MLISSRKNPKIMHCVALLKNRSLRHSEGCFVAEGLRLCKEAASFGSVRTAFYTGGALSRWKKELESIIASADESFEVSDDVAQKMGDVKTSQGIYCVVKMKHCEDKLFNAPCLVLEQVSDPGNMGTLLRSCVAFGVKTIYACNCVDVYAPKVVRAAMGAHFKLGIVTSLEITQVLEKLTQNGVKSYGAVLSDKAISLKDTAVDSGAIVIGNEGSGLSEQAVAHCSNLVLIPMESVSESLNAGVAGSILMYSMYVGGGDHR